ncbi:hypothetical protein CONCODRAFT_5418 [Conidiobolus coronatus NRRL 28638]|uniref:Uncharacterized protein n=1 Tax=Conidiobolus coronatus (strain ATCC 28846 / CBS 209.66 / NRRL 28638) TaxID=796925 RepID=A0A137PA59_CONC2|nr:hypothetical protein CONCODRAFT_5418 [Conidiobolus coronatus NRRL 28638]|eukprot:KXN71888.1 hypothetical protein CONCODRAFT_5418 [Conidiobolus coronatus NRRL 28638]
MVIKKDDYLDHNTLSNSDIDSSTQVYRCSESNTCTSSKTLTSIGNSFSFTTIPTPTGTTTEPDKLGQEFTSSTRTPTQSPLFESNYKQSSPSKQNLIDYNIGSDNNNFEEQINIQNNTKELSSYNIKLINLLPLYANDTDYNTTNNNSEYFDEYPEYREENYKPPLPAYE